MQTEREAQIRQFVTDVTAMAPETFQRFPKDAARDIVILGEMADELLVEVDCLRTALDRAAGRLGHLSTALGLSNKPLNAREAWQWSEEARAALRAG